MSTVEREEKYFIIEKYSLNGRSNVKNGRNWVTAKAEDSSQLDNSAWSVSAFQTRSKMPLTGR